MAAPKLTDHIALSVTVEVNPEMEEEFLKVMEEDAIESRKEEGCLRFDLSKNTEKEHTYAIYEMYKNKDAVAFHKTTAHYKKWAVFKESGK